MTVLVLVLGIQIVHAEDKPFADFRLELQQDEGYLIVDGQIIYHFSRAALEALDNGLPLVVDNEIEIQQPREWWWNETIWQKRFHAEVRYHALSQQYLVKAMTDDFPKAYLTQSSALEALGQIPRQFLLELENLRADIIYHVRVRSSLASDILPVPLRPLTYLSEDWQLISDWQTYYWQKDK